MFNTIMNIKNPDRQIQNSASSTKGSRLGFILFGCMTDLPYDILMLSSKMNHRHYYRFRGMWLLFNAKVLRQNIGILTKCIAILTFQCTQLHPGLLAELQWTKTSLFLEHIAKTAAAFVAG
jgi:hypothetical protein